MLKKAYGWDMISPVFIKFESENLVNSLCKIFNFSLTNGIFPSHWKKSTIIPLYKKDSPNVINNYRPVSLLSCISKIKKKFCINIILII